MRGTGERMTGPKALSVMIAALFAVTAFAVVFSAADTGNEDDFDQTLGADTDPMISVGMSHTLYLKKDGTVWAWGNNEYGKLGVGGATDKPKQVVGPGGTGYLTGMVAVAAGHSHSVALKSDGTVWTWGYNSLGQLGNGKSGGLNNSSTPVQVVGADGTGFLTNVVAISAGYQFTIALKDNGTVWAWGAGHSGVLGNGGTDDSNTPVQVRTSATEYLTSVKQIAVGYDHSIILKTDGTVWVWGSGSDRKLGDGTTADSPYAKQVVGLTNIKAVGGTMYSSLVIKNDDTLWTWGRNYSGLWGNGSGTISSATTSTPVQVKTNASTELTGVKFVGCTIYHALAVKSDGTVWAWGSGGSGRLGDGDATDRDYAVQAVGPGGTGYLTEVISVGGGTSFSVALKSDGTVWAWGSNGGNYLGIGSTPASTSTPVQVIIPASAAGTGGGGGGGGGDGGTSIVLIVAIVAIIAVAGAAAYYFLVMKKK